MKKICFIFSILLIFILSSCKYHDINGIVKEFNYDNIDEAIEYTKKISKNYKEIDNPYLLKRLYLPYVNLNEVSNEYIFESCHIKYEKYSSNTFYNYEMYLNYSKNNMIIGFTFYAFDEHIDIENVSIDSSLNTDITSVINYSVIYEKKLLCFIQVIATYPLDNEVSNYEKIIRDNLKIIEGEKI